MYRNLKAEMLKQDIGLQKIADTLQVKLDTARKKVNGSISLSLSESFKISMLFNKDNSIEYLFKRF